MLFRFDISLTDKDYFDFNDFCNVRSKKARKILWLFRIFIIIVFSAFALISVVGGGFSAEAIIGAIPYIICMLLFVFLLTPLMRLIAKLTAKKLLKDEKNHFDKQSTLEFYDDRFCEITEDVKSESAYSVLEKLTVIEGNVIYLHMNSLRAYIIPMRTFESKEQTDLFLDFMKNKGIDIDFM